MVASHRPKGQETQINKLKTRLAAAEDALAAIRDGKVDALLSPAGDSMLTLSGADNGYRVFVEAMNEGAVTIGTDETILYCNRGFATILARPLDQLIGTPFRALVAPSHIDIFAAALNTSATSPRRAQVALLDAHGDQVPTLLSITHFEEHGSHALCMVVTDLREQIRQQEVLATANLTRLLVEQALEAIAVCDSSGKIILASTALHQLCGCNPLLQRFDDVLRLDTVDGTYQAPVMRQIFDGGRFRSLEVIASPVHGGDECHMLLSAGPMALPDDAKAYVITLFNIEERKRAEEALRQAERLAAMGRLAATIAHEINNPLEAITNLLYLIAHSPQLPGDVVEFTRMAQSELERVTHITRQTLTFHRQSPHPEPVRLSELLDSVLFLHARPLMAKRIQVTREVEFTGSILAYAGELRQVMSNLFANSLEACPPGGQMRLRVYQGREYGNSNKPGVRIVVADSGSGISRESAKRIFEPFYTTKGEKGSGLGLWVSQGIVSKHGGFIHMRSSTMQQRSGTVFSIFLPFSNQEQDNALVSKAG